MTYPTINYIQVDVKINYRYVCNRCKRQDVGDTHRYTIHGFTTEDITRSMDGNARSSARYMPVGWSHTTQRGISVYTCTVCLNPE